MRTPPSPPPTSLAKTSPQSMTRRRGVETPLDHFLNLLDAETSRKTMRSALKVIAQTVMRGPADPATFPWQRLTPQDTALLYASLVKRFKRPHKYLAALRGVLRSCWLLGLISQEMFARLTYFPRQKKDGHALAPAGRMLEPREIAAMFDALAAPGTLNRRDEVMLAIAYSGGLRREEIANLTTSSLQANGTLRFTGKRGKERTVPLPPRVLALVRQWIGVVGPGPLVRRVLSDGKISKKKLSKAGISYAFMQLQQRSPGCEPFTPHDLRRTFASTLIDLTGDISSVQRVMGHGQSATTLGYDRRGEKAAKKLTALIDIPPVRR